MRKRIYKLCKDTGLRDDQYVIRNRYTEEASFEINLTIEGNLNNAKYKIPEVKKALNKVCNYPAYTFLLIIMAMFNVFARLGKKYVIGNIKNDKIENIWLSQKYKL